jgi:DsbC/DsbD-like thiol-disulfide interchange protein
VTAARHHYLYEFQISVWCLVAFIVVFATAGRPQPISSPHVTVDLITENSSIAPGQDFWVALRFNLEQGWHVYWINPGDSGEPPKVQWELPPGFQAGAIVWPYPHRLPIPPLMDYGYENTVLLPIRMHAARNLKPGDTTTLAASVNWVVCREVCIPEKGHLTVSVPVSKAASGKAATDPSANHDLFAKALSRIPQPMPRNWKLSAISIKDAFVLSVQTGRPIKKAEFFPATPLQIENAAPQKIQTNSRGMRLILKKSEQLSKPVSSLKGVLVLPAEKAYAIDAHVVSRPKSK